MLEAFFNRDLADSPTAVDATRIEKANTRLRPYLETYMRQSDTIVVAPTVGRRLRRWLPYAAAVIIALAVTRFFFGDEISNRQPKIVHVGDIAPGGNRATLTLVDGRTIDLSEAQAGIVVGDELVYNDGSAVLANGQQPTANGQPENGMESQGLSVSRLMSLTTPKGGTYQITLPDGTAVWLNAASTLKYPSHFTDDERVVELEGEAYFDVSEREKATTDGRVLRVPFKVISNGQQVEVLGTQFNISAYPDEPVVRTTLVEGSVQVALVTDHQPPTTLTPGQQAITRGAQLEVRDVDVALFTAWKAGDFRFHGTPLVEVLHQLERWYDVEVDYSRIPNEKIHGAIRRDKPLSSILETIEKTSGLTFRLNERRLTLDRP